MVISLGGRSLQSVTNGHTHRALPAIISLVPKSDELDIADTVAEKLKSLPDSPALLVALTGRCFMGRLTANDKSFTLELKPGDGKAFRTVNIGKDSGQKDHLVTQTPLMIAAQGVDNQKFSYAGLAGIKLGLSLTISKSVRAHLKESTANALDLSLCALSSPSTKSRDLHAMFGSCVQENLIDHSYRIKPSDPGCTFYLLTPPAGYQVEIKQLTKTEIRLARMLIKLGAEAHLPALKNSMFIKGPGVNIMLRVVKDKSSQ